MYVYLGMKKQWGASPKAFYQYCYHPQPIHERDASFLLHFCNPFSDKGYYIYIYIYSTIVYIYIYIYNERISSSSSSLWSSSVWKSV